MKPTHDDPVVSVVVTAFNRFKLVRRALDSLIAQSFVAWEAIVVDDGSTDGTHQVAEDFARRDPRVRLVRQPNSGLAFARNAGLRACRGALMTFLDSDDEYAPGHLASRLAVFERPSGPPDGIPPDFVHGGVSIVGGPDWVADRGDPARRIAIADCVVGGTFVFRRRVFEALDGFRRPDYGDDADFMARALAHGGFRIVKIDAPATYIYHRDTPDGLCNAMAARNGLDAPEVPPPPANVPPQADSR